MQGWHEGNWENKPADTVDEGADDESQSVSKLEMSDFFNFYQSRDRIFFASAQKNFLNVKDVAKWGRGVKIPENTILKPYSLYDPLDSYAMENRSLGKGSSFHINNDLFVKYNIWAPEGACVRVCGYVFACI